jgi:TolB-like protein
MSPSVSQQADDSPDQFNLGTMLLIALAAVLGTTMTVWIFHFIQVGNTGVTKPLPSLAVLPFQSLSASKEDIRSDQKLTDVLIGQLARISHVEALPLETDADPLLIGRELGVKALLIGKVVRTGSHLRVKVQMVSTRDGKQVWTGSFDGDSSDLSSLSKEIDEAVAPHLTALLD